MKLQEIIASEQAISNLLKEKLPINAAFDLKMFVFSVDKELKAFYEIRDSKIQEYGEDIGGGQYQIKDESKIEEFKSELALMLDKDIDIPLPDIKREYLAKAEISTQDLITLNWLIK